MLKEYDLRSDVLETIVASAMVSRHHKELRELLAKRTRFNRVSYVTSRVQYSHRPGRILDVEYREVASDFREWLSNELEARNGDSEAVWDAFHQSGYVLTEIRRSLHYFTHDWGGAQDDFVQFRIWQEQEFLAEEPFERKIWGRCLEDGERCNPVGYFQKLFPQSALGPSKYCLRDVIDMKTFNAVANDWYEYERGLVGRRLINQPATDLCDPYRISAYSDGHDRYRYMRDGQRFFDDWTTSSLGQAGERISKRWCFDILEHLDARNVRSLSFIPQWTHRRNITSIGGHAVLDLCNLYARLKKFDDRIGAPFSWYFYGLQGDLITQPQMQLIGAAVRCGLIELPRENSAVLQRWMEQPYGF
ncbi:hypothetical protein [Paraburkholderia terrae]|uniref:Uncharacterized protein n=1 Tax=Paraburkholderia terrae TaxID=311230 RepID=A0A2I8EZV6_9BURK|nr:hypothetical protein [Paraburkholderia terrae]AUT65019.1 hypothetical protein C2L65_36115 [Paraburkholderia terrae]